MYVFMLQFVGLAQRLEELEGVRQQQEGAIIAKQEENTAASSQIKVKPDFTKINHTWQSVHDQELKNSTNHTYRSR